MAKQENDVLNLVRLVLAKLGVKIFRNHVGMLEDKKGMKHRFGLHKGSSDLIGWKSVEVTQDMVGRKVAVFVSMEVKTPKGRVSKHQDIWIDNLLDAGGIAGVVRSAEDAERLMDGFSDPQKSRK